MRKDRRERPLYRMTEFKLPCSEKVQIIWSPAGSSLTRHGRSDAKYSSLDWARFKSSLQTLKSKPAAAWWAALPLLRSWIHQAFLPHPWQGELWKHVELRQLQFNQMDVSDCEARGPEVRRDTKPFLSPLALRRKNSRKHLLASAQSRPVSQEHSDESHVYSKWILKLFLDDFSSHNDFTLSLWDRSNKKKNSISNSYCRNKSCLSFGGRKGRPCRAAGSDYNPEILHIHLANVQQSAFSVGLKISVHSN